MSRGHGFCDKFALLAVTTATAHCCERRGMGRMARCTDSVRGWLCLGDRLEDGLMTIGADLGLALVFVRLVASGAFFVTVTPLRNVASGASRCCRLAGMAAVAIHAVGMRFRFPSRQHCLNWRMALDTARSIWPECMRGVASRTALMSRCQFGLERLWHLECMTSNTQIGRLWSWAVDRVALRAILVCRYVGRVVLIHDLAVACRAVVAMATIGGVRAMRLVTQPTGIDIAVHDVRCNRFGLGRGERLTWRRWLAAVTGGATRCAWVTSATLPDELMARQAGNLGHAMLVHRYLGVATGAREAIDRSRVLP